MLAYDYLHKSSQIKYFKAFCPTESYEKPAVAHIVITTKNFPIYLWMFTQEGHDTPGLCDETDEGEDNLTEEFEGDDELTADSSTTYSEVTDIKTEIKQGLLSSNCNSLKVTPDYEQDISIEWWTILCLKIVVNVTGFQPDMSCAPRK